MLPTAIRLESVLRSPVFAHFGESIDGADSIRALGSGQVLRFERASQAKIDRHHAVFFTEQIAAQWFQVCPVHLGVFLFATVASLCSCFGLILDVLWCAVSAGVQVYLSFLSSIVIASVTACIIAKQGTINPGMAALALSYSTELTQVFQFVVWMHAMLQQKFNGVERVLEYTSSIEQEAPQVVPDNRPPLNWPAAGQISFDKFQMRYRKGLEPVLSGVSLVIAPGEKVGIVGGTSQTWTPISPCPIEKPIEKGYAAN